MSKPAAKQTAPKAQPRPGHVAAAAPPRRRARLNLRAALALGVAVVVGVPAYFVVQAVQQAGSGKALLRQADRYLAERPPRPDLALRYLDRYLALNPGDVAALDKRSALLADAATRSAAEVDAATRAADYVLRLDPEGPGRQETRRRLAGLYLRMEQFAAPADVKYRTAEATARDLIARDAKAGTPVAGDRRLLARALLGLDRQGARGALAGAIAEFEAAAALEPGDVAGAEQLAYLDVDRLKDRARADAVLDALLKAAPTAEARLARARHYARFGPSRQARQEMAAAVAAFPASTAVRLAAAEDALDRNEVAAARAHLAAVPAADREDFRVRFLTGVLELREHHADDAIASWRQGLRLTAGTNADLSFRLAWVLLQLGRLDDAAPLIDQVRRLTPGDRPSDEFRYLEALRDVRTGDLRRAMDALLEVRPTIDKRLRGAVNLTLAQCYEAQKDEQHALEAYRAACADQPRSADARLNAARLVASMRGPEAAADEVREGLKQSPDDPAMLLGLAGYLLRQRRFPEMKAALDRAEGVAPGAPGLAMLRADYLSNTGRLDEAVQLVGAAAARDRRDVTLWVAYANGLARQGRVEEALKALEGASAADAAGDHAALRIARARYLQQLGRGRQARLVLAKDVAALPPAERAAGLRALADLQALQGDRPAALATLRQWAATAPDDPQPALTMLDMALAGGRDETAARDAIAALKAVRQGGGAYEYIGRAYEVLRGDADAATRPARLAEAERLVAEVARKAPQLYQGPLMRGLILEERARDGVLAARDRDRLLDDAILAYKKALDAGGGAAVPRLVELYTRRNRLAELSMLRKRVASDRAFDQMCAEASVRFGLADEADRIARQIVEADPDGLDARVLQAGILKRLGRPDDAEEALRDLARARPGDPGPWFQLLIFQVGRNRRAAAEATVGQIVRNVKGDRPEFLRAQAWRIVGDLKQAAELYRAALKAYPDDQNVARGAAEFDETTGRLDEAEAVLRRVLEKDPAAAWASRKLALILSARPKDAAAWAQAAKLVAPPEGPAAADLPEDRLTRAVVYSRSPDPKVSAAAVPLLRSLKDDMPPGTPIARVAGERLARYFLEADRPEEAWKLATDALAEGDDPAPDAVALYAEVLLRNKKPDEAESQVDRLAKLEPDGLRPEVLRARVLMARGQADAADAALEAAYRSREKAPDALAAAGAVLAALMDLGRLEAAERVARREAELRPGDAWMLARVLARRERIKDALDACRDAIKAGGSRIAVQIALSLAIVPGASAETLAGADDVIAEALRREPESIELALQRAQVRHLQGRFDDELAIYRAVQAGKNPAGDYGFLNNWAWTLSESLHRPAEALRLVDDAIRRSGRFPLYLDTRGVILARLDRAAEAVEVLEESAPSLPAGQGYFHLARAQHLAGQDARARASLAKARAEGLRPDTMEAADRRELEALDARLAAPTPAPAPAPARAPAPAARPRPRT